MSVQMVERRQNRKDAWLRSRAVSDVVRNIQSDLRVHGPFLGQWHHTKHAYVVTKLIHIRILR